VALFDAELLLVAGDHCHQKPGPALEEYVISNVPGWPAEDKNNLVIKHNKKIQ